MLYCVAARQMRCFWLQPRSYWFAIRKAYRSLRAACMFRSNSIHPHQGSHGALCACHQPCCGHRYHRPGSLASDWLTCRAGLSDGLRQAAQGLRVGIHSAASALVMKPAQTVRDGHSISNAMGRALRAAPSAAAAPASAAAAAVRATLLGARNALSPGHNDRKRFGD